MNGEELGKVLAEVQVGDNRKIDSLVLTVWRTAIGSLQFGDAVEAVRMHRAERPDVYIGPGHVLANVRVILRRRERAARIDGSRTRAIAPNVITLDRQKFERETQRAIDAARAAKAARP
jgi:hypothetical protein